MNQRQQAKFRATAGMAQAFGCTPHQALSSLVEQLSEEPDVPIVIWPYNRGDMFFTEGQQRRLQELKARLDDLSADERAELEQLVEASFEATIPRSQSIPPV